MSLHWRGVLVGVGQSDERGFFVYGSSQWVVVYLMVLDSFLGFGLPIRSF